MSKSCEDNSAYWQSVYRSCMDRNPGVPADKKNPGCCAQVTCGNPGSALTECAGNGNVTLANIYADNKMKVNPKFMTSADTGVL